MGTKESWVQWMSQRSVQMTSIHSISYQSISPIETVHHVFKEQLGHEQ
jgi:hypothetical protein